MYQVIKYYQENNQKILDYRLQSRYLWNDHISFTRNAIISILADLSDVPNVSARLIKNQEDIGIFISPYYSSEKVSYFVDLLKQHIMIATEVINGVEGAEDNWRMNGNDIVNYMQFMNKDYWPTSIISPMWSVHLDATISQVNARKNSMWDTDIYSYDENHTCMSDFADVFSSGVIYQNMDMFCWYYDRSKV